jgi:multiple sugar transport system ATP-binding protein
VLGIRPEGFEDAAFSSPDLPTIDVSVTVLEELGADAHVFFLLDARRVSAESLEAGTDDATLVVEPRVLVNARVDPRTNARVGATMRLAVDPARFHFFDPDTGTSLLGASTRAQEQEPVPLAP